MLEFLVDNIFVVFAGKIFQQRIGIPMGTNCASLLAGIFLYSYEANLYSPCSRPVGKRLASQFNFIYRYIDDELSINNPDFENYLRQMYPLSLRSKTQRRATLLLPTWIYSCQLVRTVNFELPFATSVTISISILQTFRSWVATSHLRQPMAFLSHNSSYTPRLDPLMNVLFWGRCNFPISFSGRDMSRNVWNRLWWSSMVGMGILPNNMRFPSPECYTAFWRMTIYSETRHWWAITPFFDPLLIWTLLPNLTWLPNCVRFP